MTADDCHQVQIQLGLPERFREEGAALYYEAFAPDLDLLMRSRENAIPIISCNINLEPVVAAIADDRLAGLIGFNHPHPFVDARLDCYTAEFSWLSGFLRWGMVSVFERLQKSGELLLDGVAVHPDFRGMGIGTLLFRRLFEFAGNSDYQSIRLDVYDNNHGARRLYERLGFVAVQTKRLPPLSHRFVGYSAVITMIKQLN